MTLIELDHLIENTDDVIIIDNIELSYEQRKRGRIRTQSSTGIEIGIFIDRGQTLEHGQCLSNAQGDVFSINAKAEQLMQADTDNWQDFSEVCYHLGNRHLPIHIGERHILFQPDHVIKALCEHYGLVVTEITAEFTPINGAYGKYSGHHHHSSADIDMQGKKNANNLVAHYHHE
jgi:urease accessory protein